MAWYLPTNLDPPMFGDGRSDLDHIIELVAGPLADPAVKKRAQNAKYDMLVLRKYGVEIDGLDFDTMVASYCVSPGEM